MTANAKDFLVSSVLDKTRELVVECTITANATPASKKHSSDIPGTLILRTEGLTADADALETLAFTTAVDNSTGDSVFGIILKGANLPNNAIEKVLSVVVTEQTALATSLAVSKVGSSFLTAEGNIAFNIAGTGLNLASESPTLLVRVIYKEE